MTQRREFLQLSAAALAAVGLPVLAQDDYPNKPISLLVPFPPGGVADTVGRPVAEAMGRALKQSVIVENKGGAGGGIGMAQVAKSRADGYSLLMALSSIVVLPEADKVLQRAPMFTLEQLKPVARFTADPTALVVRADSPWKTYKDFMAAVKAKPGAITFGSSGNYGTMHVPMEQLKVATSSFMLHVPYTGAGPAVLALLAGQVDALATGKILFGLSPTGDLSGKDLDLYNSANALAPGVYKFSSSAQLTGALYLDAQNSADAVWVFQIGSTLTTATTSSVNLINGALNADYGLYWQVGESATLGTSTAFAGNILADQSITLNTSASILCGRAIALNAAVTMDTNTISNDCLADNIAGNGYGSVGFSGRGTIPEPGTLALAGLAFAALRFSRRR